VVVPYLALPLVVLAVLSSPGVVDRIERWRRTREAATGQASSPTSTVADIRGREHTEPSGECAPRSGPADCRLDVDANAAQHLTDTELCLEWRRSFVTLQSAGSPAQRMRMVAQRQIYLDEIERRSPSALHAWLASGARAAGGPDRFLNHQRRDPRSDAA
jgi:hypothetical protein